MQLSCLFRSESVQTEEEIMETASDEEEHLETFEKHSQSGDGGQEVGVGVLDAEDEDRRSEVLFGGARDGLQDFEKGGLLFGNEEEYGEGVEEQEQQSEEVVDYLGAETSDSETIRRDRVVSVLEENSHGHDHH